jgi:hypothetical protein
MMSRDGPREHRCSRRRSTRRQLAVLTALTAVTAALSAGLVPAPAPQDEPQQPNRPSFTPTEQIDVEQAVDFPVDI